MKKLLVFCVFVGVFAAVCQAGTISQNWNSTAGWTPYVGANSGSTISIQPDGDPYLKTAMNRNVNNDGRAVIYTSLGSDSIAAATGVSGMANNIWMQCDIGWVSGTTSKNSTFFGIFTAAGDNDGNPANNWTGINIGGGTTDNMVMQIMRPGALAALTFGAGGGKTVTDRLKLHFYKSGSTVLVDGAVYSINNTTREISTTPLFSISGATFMSGTDAFTVSVDAFGVRNTVASSASCGYKFDNMYFSTVSEAGSTPLPFWVPEPATIAILALGGFLVAGRKR